MSNSSLEFHSFSLKLLKVNASTGPITPSAQDFSKSTLQWNQTQSLPIFIMFGLLLCATFEWGERLNYPFVFKQKKRKKKYPVFIK